MLYFVPASGDLVTVESLIATKVDFARFETRDPRAGCFPCALETVDCRKRLSIARFRTIRRELKNK